MELPEPLEKKGEYWLPPRVGAIADGSVTWQPLGDIDYDILGYFLSCHLIIEHYLEEYLKASYPSLDWDAAKPTFGQLASLLTTEKFPAKYNAVQEIKYMNSLRNKLSHNVEFKITDAELLPFKQYISKISGKRELVPGDPKHLLSVFTSLVCVYFAGNIAGRASDTVR